MRLIYSDESGLAAHEPYVVVAGVIVDADNELIPIEEHLGALVKKHIPEDERQGFVFHASDIWSGKKYFADREKWPAERRFPILFDLVSIPEKFQLPITMGHKEKAPIPEYDTSKIYSAEELIVAAHCLAYAASTMNAERFLREMYPDEVALMIAEDNTSAKTAVKRAHSLYRSATALKENEIDIDCFPLERIRDTVHFAKKEESCHLQLADTCAFVIKGYLENRPKNAPFYEQLKPWMIVHPKKMEPT